MASSEKDKAAAAKDSNSKDSADSPPSPQTSHDEGKDDDQKPLARLKTLWAKTGLTTPVLKLMIKGALTPTIALAAYQSTAWADTYTTIGYLVGVITQLSVVIQPRAKFLQTIMVQILVSCLAAAIACLACFCAVHARINSEGVAMPGTGGPGTSGAASKNAQTATYNSSASAVAGIWLFVEIYCISAFRASFPQHTIACIMFAIFANVSLTYAPQFGEMAQAEAFVKSLITAFLTGFALATGVSLFVFPVTSRELLFDDMKTLIADLQGCLGANLTYLNSLEGTDMFAAQKTNSAGQKPAKSPEANAFLDKMKALSATHTKCATNLTFAKREIALGKLGPDDLQQTFKLLREMTIPMVGLSTLSDIFERISEESGWDRSKSFAVADLADATTPEEKARIESIAEWHELIRLLREPFSSLTETIEEGLQHVLITLQLCKRPAGKGAGSDAEAKGDIPQPGDSGFAAYLDRKSNEFNDSKRTMLRGWSQLHGIELPEDYFSNPDPPFIKMPRWMDGQSSSERVRLRRQLMVFLYVESMLFILSRRTYSIVQHADALQASGKLSKTRLIFPGYKRLRKWVRSTLQNEDAEREDHFSDSYDVSLGQAYRPKIDPEHLPPQNAWERSTNIFRKLGQFFSSPASAFGLRVAVATMSIAIVNYLRDSQVFFTKERLFWAQIMTSIAMVPSAGQSLRIFFLRIFGTFVATILAMLAWYIPDQKTPGILVFYYIFQLPGLFLIIKRPTLTPVGMISTITLTLIVGYELQVRKIGIQEAESNGQVYHPVYELGPIRLVTVIAGIFVAWVFTIFPYPITEKAKLRENTAKSLYLLANYYTTVDETVRMRLRGGEEANEDIKDGPAQKLGKARLKIFSKTNMLLSGMRSQTALVKYDIPCGGRFPKAEYEQLIERVQSVLSFISLISVASATFSTLQSGGDKDSRYVWLRNLRKMVNTVNLTSKAVTTLLSLLSASLGHSQPLPPFLYAPPPYALTEKLEEMDSELLSIRHVAEPGYASFAVIQIAVTCLVDDLKDLLEEVKRLVGEQDFSYHIKSTADVQSSEEDLRDGKKSKEIQRLSKED